MVVTRVETRGALNRDLNLKIISLPTHVHKLHELRSKHESLMNLWINLGKGRTDVNVDSNFQEEIYLQICVVPTKIVQERKPNDTRLTAIASDIQEKFSKLFKLYSNCHLHFNSGGIVETPLLGKSF